MIDTSEVHRVAAQLPACYHGEYKLAVARQIVANRHHGLALDSSDSLDAAIRDFFRPNGGGQIMATAPSAAMPASMRSDNYTAATGASSITATTATPPIRPPPRSSSTPSAG